jgi:hypothetical protein
VAVRKEVRRGLRGECLLEHVRLLVDGARWETLALTATSLEPLEAERPGVALPAGSVQVASYPAFLKGLCS